MFHVKHCLQYGIYCDIMYRHINNRKEMNFIMKIKYSLMSPTESRMEHIARMTIAILAFALVLIAVLGNLGILGDIGILEQNWGAAALVGTLLCITVTAVAYVSDKLPHKRCLYPILLFAAALLLRLIAINVCPIAPSSDFKDTYDIACTLARADMSEWAELIRMRASFYYSIWSAHMPFIMLEAFILKLFGIGIYPIQVIFNIFGALSCVMSALIAKRLYGRCAAVVAGMLMCIFPLNLMYAPILSNQHPATCFFLCAVYFIVANPLKKRTTSTAVAALFASLSELFRPEMIVLVIAVVCYLLYKYILTIKSKKDIKKALLGFSASTLAFVGVYTVIILTTNSLLMHNGYIERNITDTNAIYKIAVGLNYDTLGQWNETDAANMNNDAALAEAVAQRTADPAQVLKLGIHKLAYQYGTYSYSWCLEGKSADFVANWYGALTNSFMLIVLLLCLVRIILSMRTYMRHEVFVMIVMLGYFAIFMLIEVQNRYNYMMISIFMLMAGGAVSQIYSAAKNELTKSGK